MSDDSLTVKEAIEQGNRMIAEFLGYGFGRGKFYSMTGPRWFKVAKYDRSWDWLMPVAKKILELRPLRGKAMAHILQMELVVSALESADINKVYFSCIIFINWYNSQSQTTHP